MFNNIVNLLNRSLQPHATRQIQTISKPVLQENPFATPFITVQNKRQSFYGKNTPVLGGYFAGYYNGKQNIVGRKLFVNV